MKGMKFKLANFNYNLSGLLQIDCVNPYCRFLYDEFEWPNIHLRLCLKF